MRWSRQGVRRPGYSADRWAEEFIFDKFEHLGLQSVRFESVEAALWKDSHAELSVVAGQRTTESSVFQSRCPNRPLSRVRYRGGTRQILLASQARLRSTSFGSAPCLTSFPSPPAGRPRPRVHVASSPSCVGMGVRP